MNLDIIEIGPVQYKIEHNAEAINTLRVDMDDASIRAHIHYSSSTITVDPALSASQKRLSLLHEILHGTLSGLGLHGINNEDVVTPTASSLLDTLRRNPKMVAFLMEGVNGC